MSTLTQTDFKAAVLAHLEANPPAEGLHLQAAQYFADTALPTTKHEEWKYVNLKPLLATDFAFASPTLPAPQTYAPFVQQYPEQEANVLVFVNGVFVKELSHVNIDEQVGVICNLQEAFAKYPEITEKYFGKYAKYDATPFTALNTAFACDGAFVWIKNNQELAAPIIVHYIADASQAHTFAQVRSLVVAGVSSKCAIVEHYQSTQVAQHSFTNMVSEIVVRANAHVDHYKIQNEGDTASHIGFTQAHQERDSYFANTTISLTGQIVRNNLHIAIDGENCEGFMNGLYALTGNTLVDNHTAVDHIKPSSHSNELYKGLLDGKSAAVFNGKIFVRQDAQKTNAYQSNKNILLSDTASIDAKPQLEIWADDVKCSHGHATGALDEEPLFYLRSRGISVENARAMLMFAFAEDMLERIKIAPVRQYTEKVIAERLGMDI